MEKFGVTSGLATAIAGELYVDRPLVAPVSLPRIGEDFESVCPPFANLCPGGTLDRISLRPHSVPRSDPTPLVRPRKRRGESDPTVVSEFTYHTHPAAGAVRASG